ncbi:MAG: ROK family protein [Pseudomonadota bacterium]|nr:ROK family protein [Pseudomonadota bacterium]
MIRIGVDFGGTKIEAAAIDADGAFVSRVRAPNPGHYVEAIETVRRLVDEAERDAGVGRLPVGIGLPGSISPRSGLVRNANSVWLNGTPFDQDLRRALERPVRVENDANCFALSEALDGGGQGARVVFGAILGTGCGGGLVVDGRTIEGRNAIGGEWGHTPLPWPTAAERGAHRCWCGRTDCLETWISGSAFAADYAAQTGNALPGQEIARRADDGESAAAAALERYVDRLGRALAVICDIADPEVIVCGGGMSNVSRIYRAVIAAIERHVFSDVFTTPVLAAKHGDSSGVRGAAWLWPIT